MSCSECSPDENRRIALLERRLHITWISIPITLITALIMGQATSQPHPAERSQLPAVVEAQAFVVRDQTGRIFGRFDARGGKPNLVMHDATGAPRLILNINDQDGAQLMVMDAQGKAGVTVITSKAIGSRLQMTDQEGVSRVSMSGDIDGSSNAIAIMEKQGNPVLMLASVGDGAYLCAKRAHGNEAVEISSSSKEGTSIDLCDDKNVKRAVLGSTTLVEKATGGKLELPLSSLVLFGTDGKPLWKAP